MGAGILHAPIRKFNKQTHWFTKLDVGGWMELLLWSVDVLSRKKGCLHTSLRGSLYHMHICGNSIFNLLRNWPTIFSVGPIRGQSQQQHAEIPISPCAFRYFLKSVLILAFFHGALCLGLLKSSFDALRLSGCTVLKLDEFCVRAKGSRTLQPSTGFHEKCRTRSFLVGCSQHSGLDQEHSRCVRYL